MVEPLEPRSYGGLLSYSIPLPVHPQCKFSAPGLANAWSTGCWLPGRSFMVEVDLLGTSIDEAVQTCF